MAMPREKTVTKCSLPTTLFRIRVLLLLLVCATLAGGRQDESAIPAGMCKEFNILVASNASAGTQVVLASGNDSPPVSTAIAGHYLPPECRVNHLCSILDFGHPSGTSHYIIPSIGGFVLLSHWADYDNRLPWHLFHDVTEDCNPTSAFLARSNQILVVACMNLRSRPHGTLYYMHYDVLPDSTGSGGIIRRNTVLPTKSEIIYNPATISEIIHVRGQAKCQQEDNLYCVDNGDVLYFPTSGTSDPGFSVSNAPLENCIGYQSLEHYPGDDNLIIRCSNYRTALYGSCSTGRFTYAPDDNIPYPCTNWSTVAYLNGTQLTLDGETQQLPSGDISFAKCVQGVNGPIFIASSNGSIFITRFDGNNVIEITSGNCSSNSDGTCPRPVFSKNNDIFVTFDSGSGDLMIVNVTEGCMGDPVIARIPIPIQPDLMSVSLARGVYNCSCSAAQSAEPPTTEDISQTEPATVKNQTEQTERHDSTTATHQSEATFPITTSSQTSSHPASISIEGLLAGVLITVAVLLSVIVTIIIYLARKHVQRSRVKEERDLSPTVEYPLQESPASRRSSTDPGDDAEDQGDGGYVSAATPTTTSLSGSISGASACTESGPPDGKTRIQIHSTLPFTSTQLRPELVHEQYQSRTADNRDSEDMDNKVHKFMTENNNRERQHLSLNMYSNNN